MKLYDFVSLPGSKNIHISIVTRLSIAPKARKCIHWQLVLISVTVHGTRVCRTLRTPFQSVLWGRLPAVSMFYAKDLMEAEQQLVRFCAAESQTRSYHKSPWKSTHIVIPHAMIIITTGNLLYNAPTVLMDKILQWIWWISHYLRCCDHFNWCRSFVHQL